MSLQWWIISEFAIFLPSRFYCFSPLRFTKSSNNKCLPATSCRYRWISRIENCIRCTSIYIFKLFKNIPNSENSKTLRQCSLLLYLSADRRLNLSLLIPVKFISQSFFFPILAFWFMWNLHFLICSASVRGMPVYCRGFRKIIRIFPSKQKDNRNLVVMEVFRSDCSIS